MRVQPAEQAEGVGDRSWRTADERIGQQQSLEVDDDGPFTRLSVTAGKCDPALHHSPWARPSWWTPYQLPPPLLALDPVPNTRYFRAGPEGRTDGGLFSLDGVHPTTVAYGVLAQEVIKVMELASGPHLPAVTGQPREGPVVVDFERLLLADRSSAARQLRSPTPSACSAGWTRISTGFSASFPSRPIRCELGPDPRCALVGKAFARDLWKRLPGSSISGCWPGGTRQGTTDVDRRCTGAVSRPLPQGGQHVGYPLSGMVSSA